MKESFPSRKLRERTPSVIKKNPRIKDDWVALKA
jgi:hypothetical protein